ncbi:MAG: SRPBCC family protein [Acidimicrobiia bacterium]
MAYYKFQSEWALTAAVGRVFELACHPEDFSTWWPSVKVSQLLEEGDEDGVGARAAYTLRSPLLYSMRFVTTTVEIQRPSRIHALVRGDLVGTGTYLLEGDENRTQVRFVWSVSTTKTWMNLFAPLARPVFVWAHQRVMQRGAVAMAKHLGATLLSTSTAVPSDRR